MAPKDFLRFLVDRLKLGVFIERRWKFVCLDMYGTSVKSILGFYLGGDRGVKIMSVSDDEIYCVYSVQLVINVYSVS